jgi:c-di-GMP phosphodiesterase
MSKALGTITETPEQCPAGSVFLARQPICHRDLRTIGYELLFRSSHENAATIEDGSQSTIQTIVNSFMEIGLKRVVGDRLAFINVTREFILNDGCRALPKNRVVLEVLEDDEPDDDMIEALTNLSRDGYKIALDDFIELERVAPILHTCDIIKIDARQVDPATIKDELARLPKTKAKLLAEKVETYQEYEFYKELGCELFQGYFFCRPTMLSAKRTPTNRLAILRLLAKLQEDVGPREIEEIIIQDLTLSYRLLKYINSAYVALPRKVESISQAARLVGTEKLRSWASLMLINRLDGKPHELMVTSMIRARMCELLAVKLGQAQRERFFTVGLFSTLDALLDTPMDEALKELPLSDDIRQALLTGTGLAGDVLKLVKATERVPWVGLPHIPVDERTVQTILFDSIDWTERLLNK